MDESDKRALKLVDSANPSKSIEYRCDDSGRPLSIIHNLVLALSHGKSGYEISYDVYLDDICIRKPGGEWLPLLDHDRVNMRCELENKHKFKPINKDLFRDALLVVAMDHQRDSAHEWLNSISWDGRSRIENFVRDYWNASEVVGDTKIPGGYFEGVSRYLWSALAGRLLEPGVKADMVPVLVSVEGTRKSTSVAAMVPFDHWFSGVDFTDAAADLARKIKGRSVVELDELRGLKSRAKEHIKSLITTRRDDWRRLYGESVISYYRRCVFIGTSNDDQFLDADGSRNRRWLPLYLEPDAVIDVEAIERDREQLWAEAVEMFREYGVMWQQAEQLAQQVVGAFQSQDAWLIAVEDWLSLPATELVQSVETGGDKTIGDIPFTTAEALVAVGVAGGRDAPRDSARMAALLRSIGYQNSNIRRRGRKARWWVRGSI